MLPYSSVFQILKNLCNIGIFFFFRKTPKISNDSSFWVFHFVEITEILFCPFIHVTYICNSFFYFVLQTSYLPYLICPTFYRVGTLLLQSMPTSPHWDPVPSSMCQAVVPARASFFVIVRSIFSRRFFSTFLANSRATFQRANDHLSEQFWERLEVLFYRVFFFKFVSPLFFWELDWEQLSPP